MRANSAAVLGLHHNAGRTGTNALLCTCRHAPQTANILPGLPGMRLSIGLRGLNAYDFRCVGKITRPFALSSLALFRFNHGIRAATAITRFPCRNCTSVTHYGLAKNERISTIRRCRGMLILYFANQKTMKINTNYCQSLQSYWGESMWMQLDRLHRLN